MKLRPSSSAEDQEIGPLIRLVLLCLAAAPAVSGTARGLLFPGLKVSDLLLVAAALLLLLKARGRLVPFDIVGLALVFYACVSILVTVLNFLQRSELSETTSFAKEVSGVPQFVLLYACCFSLARMYGARILVRWSQLSVAIGVLVALLAIFQSLEILPIRQFLTLITGNSNIVNPIEWKVDRATGPFNSWHALGIYLSFTAGLAMVLLKVSPGGRPSQLYLIICSIFIITGLFTAITFTPMLVLVISGVAAAGWLRSLVWSPVVLLAGGLFLSFTGVGSSFLRRVVAELEGAGAGGFVPQTIMYRYEVWVRDYIPLIKANWLDGYGPITSSDNVFAFTESMYIHLGVTGGIPLIFAYCVFVFVALSKAWKFAVESDSEPTLREFARQLVVWLCLILIAQLIHPYMVDAGGSWILIITLALLFGSVSSSQPASQPLRSVDAGAHL